MEDTLRGIELEGQERKPGLNPCFNGRYSQSSELGAYKTIAMCLNPCFNGRYSQRK